MNRSVFRLEVADKVGNRPSMAEGCPVAAIQAAVFNGLSQVLTEPVVGLWTENQQDVRSFGVGIHSRVISDMSHMVFGPDMVGLL